MPIMAYSSNMKLASIADGMVTPFWSCIMNSRRSCAYGGTGTVDAAFLTEQTDLVERRQKLHLLGEEDNAEGKTVQIQVSNAEVMEEYELNQVGLPAIHSLSISTPSLVTAASFQCAINFDLPCNTLIGMEHTSSAA